MRLEVPEPTFVFFAQSPCNIFDTVAYHWLCAGARCRAHSADHATRCRCGAVPGHPLRNACFSDPARRRHLHCMSRGGIGQRAVSGRPPRSACSFGHARRRRRQGVLQYILCRGDCDFHAHGERRPRSAQVARPVEEIRLECDGTRVCIYKVVARAYDSTCDIHDGVVQLPPRAREVPEGRHQIPQRASRAGVHARRSRTGARGLPP